MDGLEKTFHTELVDLKTRQPQQPYTRIKYWGKKLADASQQIIELNVQ
jgi:hypothetical protein